MHARESDQIAIIGAGCSGALVAIQLIRHATRPLIISAIDPAPTIGRGLAYSTSLPSHVLNVRAKNMSALPDQPDHFLNWMRDRDCGETAIDAPQIHENSFVPRALYGAYIAATLHETLRQATQNIHITRLQDTAIALHPEAHEITIHLASGARHTSRRVVLAIGNLPPKLPNATPPQAHRIVHGYQWPLDISDLDSNDPVLIIGAGLTMVDVVLALKARGHQGTIHILSRHGLLPRSHEEHPVYPAFLEDTEHFTSLRNLVRRVREEIADAHTRGYDWRPVLDALRPITQRLWRDLPESEQRRFLRHVRVYWDVHRHRIAPEVAQLLDHMRQTGQLLPHTGRIATIDERADGVMVAFRPAYASAVEHLHIRQVFTCTGPERRYDRIAHPLIRQLFDQGIIRSDPHHLGLATDVHGALLDANGHASSWLYTLGPPQLGMLWECIAVPDIRVQAVALAKHILTANQLAFA